MPYQFIQYKDCCDNKPTVKRLRWDHADTLGYYHSTGLYLRPLYSDLSQFELGSCFDHSRGASQLIKHVYENIVSVLCDNASNYVPKHHVNFYKFWWFQELSRLKEKAIIFYNLWKDAGGRSRVRYFPAAVLISVRTSLLFAVMSRTQ